MELLRPSPPPCPAADRPPSGATLRRSSAFRRSPPPDAPGGPVAVAVGRSPEKTLALLRWTFDRLGGGDVVLLHVHQPSPTIPTLLGKLPASQANEELVSAYRKEERECTKKILLSYMSFCHGAQVGADTIMIENGDIHKGIVELVVKHGFQKLVVGAAPDSCFKVKGKSSTTTFIAKNAPPFCEICFVSKGKHVWTREASEGTGSLLLVSSPNGHAPEERFSSRSLNSYNNETMCSPECSRSGCLTHPEMQEMQNMGETESSNTEMILSPPDFSILKCDSQNSSMTFTSTGTSFSLSSPIERRSSSAFISKDEMEPMPIYNQIKEVTREAEIMVSSELVRRKRLESETAETLNKAKAAEAAYVHEAKLREELEDQLRTARLKVEELVHQRNEVMRELQDARKTIATLDGHAHELACQRDEAAGKLDLIHVHIATLRLERQKICLLKEEAGSRLEKWRNSSHARSRNCSKVVPFGNDTFSFTKFSLSDLQSATCDFSESFKLGQSGYGCVYKGEMLNRTVVIKKLYAHNVQCQSEFQQEVYVLSNLRHPHLVTLIGVCPEGLSLVYEYLPNGSLHDRLFCKTSVPPLTWKIRIRIVAEMSSALLFLHSSKPEKIIHGDLKPENIFLDVNFNCKIGDFGSCRLVPEDTVDLPLVHRSIEPNGTFSYADLEYQRTGVLTPKTDVYSFGIIMLQLLTGKPPLGLASEVRRAMSAGKLSSILDPSAGEWPIFVARKLAEFALECTEMNSRDRPELTPAVVRELEELHVTEQRPIPSYFMCPILQEIMHDPQVAADGFTYEGSALRGWLQNGRGTSPMTNLKLEHLNLTPNHALRFAIQDWLCLS